MPKYAVLLRGVNVGRHHRVSMADLRQLLESLGHAEVATYLQSGNAVLTMRGGDPERIARQVEKGLVQQLGLDVSVLVRSGDELAAVVADNPFPRAVAQPKLLHVAFLSAQPDPVRVRALDPAAYAPDEFRIGDRAVYLRYETGVIGSRLAALPNLGVVATTRNWRTVAALARMTGGA